MFQLARAPERTRDARGCLMKAQPESFNSRGLPREPAMRTLATGFVEREFQLARAPVGARFVPRNSDELP